MSRVDKTTSWADWWNSNPQISVEDRYSTLLVALAQTRKGTKKHKELSEFISIIDNPKNYKMEKGGNVEKLDKISKALKKGSKTHKKQSEQLENASKLHKKQSDELEKIADKLEKMEKGGELEDGYKLYDPIINGYEGEQFALDYARGFDWGSSEYRIVDSLPTNKTYIDTINGIDVYYDYGADYYFFVESDESYAKGGEVVEPMIYVASLTDYNNGKLVGEFFKFSDYNDEDELLDGITDYLEGLTEEFDDGEIREEFAIHDYEGFPREYYSEYMGLEDFKQIYDFIRISEEIDLPMDIVMERASDKGHEDPDDIIDDYNDYYEQSIDGDDPSDYVYELEMAGVLGVDFFSNHIYLTPTDLRILYSEDVDKFFRDLQYDNPEEDEDELYRQAEEKADDMQDMYKNDLQGYIQDYFGGEIPNFVSKDYESAWEDLSYDYSTYYDSENDRTHIFRN